MNLQEKKSSSSISVHFCYLKMRQSKRALVRAMYQAWLKVQDDSSKKRWLDNTLENRESSIIGLEIKDDVTLVLWSRGLSS